MFPAAGRYTGAIPCMIALMLFFNFLDLKIEPRRIFRKELAVTFGLSFVIMPLITYFGLAVGIEAPYRIGLLLVACAPSGIMGIILIRYVGSSDAGLAFNNLLFTTFAAVLCVPFLLKLFVAQSIVIEIRPIIVQTSLLVIIPFLATRAANRLLRQKHRGAIRKASSFCAADSGFFHDHDSDRKHFRRVEMESGAGACGLGDPGDLSNTCRAGVLDRKPDRR